MFIELLKFEKEAKELDSKGLIKQANVLDKRIARLSYFLSNLHEFDISDALFSKLLMAKNMYNKYTKYGATDDETNNEDVDSEDTDETDRGDRKKEVEEDLGKAPPPLPDWLEKITEGEIRIDYDSSLLASRFPNNDTDDRRYFLELTSARITDETGKLAWEAWKENPNGVVIYFIAHPEELKALNTGLKRRYEIFSTAGDFSNISKEQASDILDYFVSPRQRKIFPGMCLDIFSQLLLKANGKEVSDNIINSLSQDEARVELYGMDQVFHGRFYPLYEVINRAGIAKSGGISAASAQKSLMNFLKPSPKDKITAREKTIMQMISDGKHAELLRYMVNTAFKSSEIEEKSTVKAKPDYHVSSQERALVGGDNYGKVLAKALQELAQSISVDLTDLNRDSALPRELMKLIHSKWDFSSIQSSPYALLYQRQTAQNKFAISDKYKSLIGEVVAEELEKQKTGKDFIGFFVSNSLDIIVERFASLGMLRKFEEYSISLIDQKEFDKAKESIFRKEKKYRDSLERYYSGEGKMPKLEDTSKEDEILKKDLEYLYKITIDSSTGELRLREDLLARIAALDAKVKQSIRNLGRRLSEENGIEKLNRDMINDIAKIALKYSKPDYPKRLDVTIEGEEGKGSKVMDMIDSGVLNPAEIYEKKEKEKLKKEKQEEDLAKTKDKAKYNIGDIENDIKARQILRNLSKSQRRMPAALGFVDAYESPNADMREKYVAMIKDMMLRSGITESTGTKEIMESGGIVDTEWIKKIEREHGNGYKIETINLPDIGDGEEITVVFQGEGAPEDKQYTMPNTPENRPRTEKEIKEQEIQEHGEDDSPMAVEKRMKALSWMEQFNPESTKELSDYMQFNATDPVPKEDFLDRKIMRQIIMDDSFHEKFLQMFEAEESKDRKWSLKMGFDPKNPAWSKEKNALSTGVGLNERTFRDGRLLAYQFCICGIGTTSGSSIIIEGIPAYLLGSYLRIVNKMYKQLVPDFSYSQEDISRACFAQVAYDQQKEDEEGKIKIKREKGIYNKLTETPEGRKRLMAISNEDGTTDVDNIVYLASQVYDASPGIHMTLTGTEKITDPKTGKTIDWTTPPRSYRRMKAWYTMRIKYIMDAFRYGTAGRAELTSVYDFASRTKDHLASVKSMFGNFSSKTEKIRSKTKKMMDKFREDISVMEDAPPSESNKEQTIGVMEQYPIVIRARDALEELSLIQKEFEEYSNANQEKLKAMAAEDYSKYFKRYKISGESIPKLSFGNAPEIYDRYMQYIKARYGESRPEFVRELIDKYMEDKTVFISHSSSDETGELGDDSLEKSVKYTQIVTKDIQEARAILEKYVASGRKDVEDIEEKTKALEKEKEEKKKEEAPKATEKEKKIPEVVEDKKEITEVVEDKDDAKTIEDRSLGKPTPQQAVPPQITPPVVPQQVAPITTVPQPQMDERFSTIRRLNQKYFTGKPINPEDAKLMQSLGFELENIGGGLYLRKLHPELHKYILDRQRKTMTASRRIENFITFADNEIDMYLDYYGV